MRDCTTRSCRIFGAAREIPAGSVKYLGKKEEGGRFLCEGGTVVRGTGSLGWAICFAGIRDSAKGAWGFALRRGAGTLCTLPGPPRPPTGLRSGHRKGHRPLTLFASWASAFDRAGGDAIINHLHHSATLLPGKGIYKGRQTSVLICIVNKSQVAALTAIIRSCPNTFAITSQVGEVMGNFKRLDKHGNQEAELLDSGSTQL